MAAKMMRKLVYGIGINDADYAVQPKINGKAVWCPYYARWQNILLRLTPKEWKRKPTYIGCEICKEWVYFMAFRAWMMTQNWQGKELDKDLLGDGKLYSPETCIFVSHAVNTFTTDSGAARGELPIGVSKEGNRFRATCSPIGYLGTFNTPEEAHQAWREAKIKLCLKLVDQQTCSRTIKGLRRYALALV